jgi:hypothetical protein
MPSSLDNHGIPGAAATEITVAPVVDLAVQERLAVVRRTREGALGG